MKIYPLIFILIFTFNVAGQKRVAELLPGHAAALEEFLSKNKSYGFLSQNGLDSIDPTYIPEMQKQFRKKMKPYYLVGDFNKDRITDFAIILARTGERTDNGEGFSEVHRYDYPLAVAIFNGNRKGGFTKAFLQDITAPLACFLNYEDRELYFAVFESDADTMIFTPAGKGYIIEYPEEP